LEVHSLWLLVIQRGSLSVGRFFMDYLVGCMSYTSFCVTKFAFVEVIKGCIMEIEYKQTKDFTADELQKLFLSV